ncbi:response regulator [Polyangium aurulentum]|uniref:response regulator n=1 Tax=Polyangium aurulentum TaxID=2567896 RepID=UPI00197CBEC3|nr:response regulator [Polyangium aurulentum]UQA62358.1 response regulator [Polyangium aurulentum]
MPRGLVLVIEDDEWVSSLLAGSIRDAGYDVLVCSTAKAGLDTACDREPDCIICDIDLPDHDGYWVARNVRTQPSRVSVTPFLFLSALDDQEARLEGFHVGADAYMTKPFRVDEVVAQVGALVHMASRLRKRRDSLVSVPPSAATETTAIQGDLSQMSIATVLTVLELERRTGVVEVTSKKRKAQLEVAMGFILNGSIGGTPADAITILRTMLGWKVGRFSFTPQPERPPTGNAQGIGQLLLEAVRLEDEAVRDNNEMPRSGRLSAPSIGGPQSRRDDLGPPSSQALVPSPLPKSTPQPEGRSMSGSSPLSSPLSAPKIPTGLGHEHEEEQDAADRPAAYDWAGWADLASDDPNTGYAVETPVPSSAYVEPASGDLIPESAYGDEGQLEEQLTEVSEDQLDELVEDPILEEDYERDEDHYAPFGRPAPKPGAGARQPLPPLRPGATSQGASAQRPPAAAPANRMPGPPPRKLTPMPRQPAAGLPGPPPRGAVQQRGSLPGPPPRTAVPAGGNRLPGPPPRQMTPPPGQQARGSGEFPRHGGPAPNPTPPPRNAPPQQRRSAPPPLPGAAPNQPLRPAVPGLRPAVTPAVAPRAPVAPPPRPPAGSKPELNESGIRHAPPPLPPRQPAAAPHKPQPSSPEINDKKR